MTQQMLEGKTVLVVGGGTGIGLAVAQQLASAACQVVIAGRREEVLRQAAQPSADSAPLRYHTVDVAERNSVIQLVTWVEREVGPIDILVNSAGINVKGRTMAHLQPADWDHVMAVNATGAYNCMHAVLPQMRKRRSGTIVNISSIAGLRASALGGVAYSASKFAMRALGLAVGNEDARNGIRITNIYPGEVNTPILEHRPVPVSDEHKARILQPQDVAQLVLAIVCLPPQAHVPEVVIKPLGQEFV